MIKTKFTNSLIKQVCIWYIRDTVVTKRYILNAKSTGQTLLISFKYR